MPLSQLVCLSPNPAPKVGLPRSRKDSGYIQYIRAIQYLALIQFQAIRFVGHGLSRRNPINIQSQLFDLKICLQ